MHRIYFEKLNNISNPEKTKMIGNLFIKMEKRLKIQNIKFLAQGTLYPDIIESKTSTGSKHQNKSHHNVGVAKKMNLKLIEPLKEFFKDEVRVLGKSLGLIDKINYKHPFWTWLSH